MAAIPSQTLGKLSAASNAFYVPQFKLVAHSKPDSPDAFALPDIVLHDVVEVTYKDKLEEIDSCELVVNNWDQERRCFRYIGSERLGNDGKPKDAGDPCAPYWNMFDPCKHVVELFLGYAGNLASMMRGNFVTYEPSFSQSGPPTLSVRMLNLMHSLRTKKYDNQYTAKTATPLTDTAIAQWMRGQPASAGSSERRFPVPIKPYKGKEPTLTYVIQKNQYDIDFLWQRARMNGYELRLEDSGPNHTPQLIYQPSTVKADPVYVLDWGQSLLDFKPTLTVANQYKSVTVTYFDRATQKAVDIKLNYDDPKVAPVNKKLDYMRNLCDPREERIVEKPFYNRAEAEHYCASVFTDQKKRMVKATGTTIGLPNLRAGCKILIGGTKQSLGSRLSGMYFVTGTTHTFNSSGYTTRFEARLEDE